MILHHCSKGKELSVQRDSPKGKYCNVPIHTCHVPAILHHRQKFTHDIQVILIEKLNITCQNTKKDVYHSQLTHTPIFFSDDFPTPDSNVTLRDYACVKPANVTKS